MLGIHQYSGFSAGDVLDRIGQSESYFDRFPVSENSGWKTTRAAGILAAYLAANPDMDARDVAAWAYHNGLQDWEITLDQNDGTTLSGTIYFLDAYPLGSNFSQNFRDWANGYEISELPALPAAQPTIIQQPAQNLQPTSATPTFVPSQPAPSYAPAATPAPYMTNPAGTATPLATPTAAAPQTAVAAKKTESGFPWMLLLIGAAVLFFLMNKKKGRRK